MPAMTDQPNKLTMALFILRSLRFCFLRCFSTRSACSGVKSEVIRVAVLSSSTLGFSLCEHTNSRAARTFTGFQERVCDRNRNEGGKSNDEVGEKLPLCNGQRVPIQDAP